MGAAAPCGVLRSKDDMFMRGKVLALSADLIPNCGSCELVGCPSLHDTRESWRHWLDYSAALKLHHLLVQTTLSGPRRRKSLGFDTSPSIVLQDQNASLGKTRAAGIRASVAVV